jgi:hypothetical protein
MPLQKQRHSKTLNTDYLTFRHKNKQQQVSICQNTVTMSDQIRIYNFITSNIVRIYTGSLHPEFL